ncbi:MAG: cupin domain-containing protein [Chromatiales bacterium]|nr:MAG: cupin domain-containing protein [Chromatiales bacterium]
MRTKPTCGSKSWLVAVLTCLAFNGLAADTPESGEPATTVRYSRMYVDDQQVSHFSDDELPLELKDYAPPANPIAVHTLENVDSATILRMPGNSFEDWHPAPRRQFAFILQGTVEVTVGDGEARRFSPGDVVLLEDTTGRGHTTRVVSDEDHVAVMVPVTAGP